MQYLPGFLSFVLLLSAYFNNAIADVQLTFKNAIDLKSKISFSKKRARMDHAINGSYMLFKYSGEEISVVDPTNKVAQKGVIDGINDNANTAHLKIKLEKKGKGPKIAGYKTREFMINFNGISCGTVFLAKKLLKKKEVKKFLSMVEKIPAQAQYALAQYNAMPSDCWVKGQELAKLYSENGFPLKTLNSRGDLLTEVTKVKAKKELKSSYYKIPDEYTVQESSQRSRQQARVQSSNNSDVSQSDEAGEDDKDEEEITNAEDVKEKLKEKRDKKKKKLKEKLKNLFD